MDRQAEVQRLAQSDRHIATAEQHITKQQLLIDNLRADGIDHESCGGNAHGLRKGLRGDQFIR